MEVSRPPSRQPCRAGGSESHRSCLAPADSLVISAMTSGLVGPRKSVASFQVLCLLLLGAAGALGVDLFDEVEETNTFLGARYGARPGDFPGLTVTRRSDDGRQWAATPAEVPARVGELLGGSAGRVMVVYHTSSTTGFSM